MISSSSAINALYMENLPVDQFRPAGSETVTVVPSPGVLSSDIP